MDGEEEEEEEGKRVRGDIQGLAAATSSISLARVCTHTVMQRER